MRVLQERILPTMKPLNLAVFLVLWQLALLQFWAEQL